MNYIRLVTYAIAETSHDESTSPEMDKLLSLSYHTGRAGIPLSHSSSQSSLASMENQHVRGHIWVKPGQRLLALSCTFGCSRPCIISFPSKPRLCTTSASSYLPRFFKTEPRLLTLMNVSRCSHPSTFSLSSQPRRYIASASSYLPSFLIKSQDH